MAAMATVMRLPTVRMATTAITHTLARLTDITGHSGTMAAFSLARDPGMVAAGDGATAGMVADTGIGVTAMDRGVAIAAAGAEADTPAVDIMVAERLEAVAADSTVAAAVDTVAVVDTAADTDRLPQSNRMERLSAICWQPFCFVGQSMRRVIAPLPAKTES